MAQVKLDLRSKSVPAKAQFIRTIVTKMTGNASFPTPDPALAAITALADELEQANTDRQAAAATAQQLTSALTAKEAEVDAALNAIGKYVEGKALGSEEIILSSGLDTRSDGAPIGELPAPDGFITKVGNNDGELKAKWDSVPGAMSYLLQFSPDPMTSDTWEFAGVSTKSKFTLKGLDSGKKYWMRVCAIGAAGQGPWSDPAVKVAP